MRISAGDLKGRKIRLKKTRARHGALRPTSSKVRESVFNIIGGMIKDSIFVDLYAGTGAVGIEAISRGAKTVFFVEADRKRAEMTEKTMEEYGCVSRGNMIRGKAADFLRKAHDEDMKFDIVFLDPPYYSEELDNALEFMSDGRILSDGGIVIAEHLSKKKLPAEIGRLMQKKAYKYGDTMLTLFRKG